MLYSNRTGLTALGKHTFESGSAEASYSYADQRFYLTKAKTSPGQVEFKNLSESDKKIFRKARSKEIASLTGTKSVTILSLEESRKFAKDFPDYIIDSRFVLKSLLYEFLLKVFNIFFSWPCVSPIQFY